MFLVEKCGYGRFWVILGHWGFPHCGFLNRKLDFWDFPTGSTGIRTRNLHCESWVSCYCTNTLKPCLLRFPAPGGPVGQNAKCRKVAQFFGETFGADGFFFPKVPLGPGNLVFFPFFTRARDFFKCLRPKTGQNPNKSPFATTWGSNRKKSWSKKIAENYSG